MRMLHLLALAFACGPTPDRPCPSVDTAELDCPVQLHDLSLTACSAIPEGPAATEADLTASVASTTLHLELSGVLFRDDNEVCAFAERQEDDIRVLLQPCVLAPEDGVSKGDCWYETLSLDVTDVELVDAQTVTVLHRVDNPPEFPPYPPKVLATATLD